MPRSCNSDLDVMHVIPAERPQDSFQRKAYRWATAKGLTDRIPDRVHLSLLYWAHLGYRPNLDQPCTFNEKLQWLKIHDRNPLYTTLCDKVAVKGWVAERIGARYVTPTYAIWDSLDKIDTAHLPDQFVLKINGDSGGIAICRDRATFDLESAMPTLEKNFGRNYYYRNREWPYKDVRPLAFAEEYLNPGHMRSAAGQQGATGGVIDYKLYCFDGVPRLLYVSQGLEDHATARISFLDLDWTFAPFKRHDYAAFEELPARPGCYGEMLDLARVLSAGIPFVRVDFIEYEGQPRFSEMTFYPCAGLMEFDPPEWDAALGELLDLSGAYRASR